MRSRSARSAAGPRRASWSSSSTRSSACATAAARCRAATTRARTGRWAAASRPACGDLDPNLYRERLDAALRLFVDRRDGGGALLAHLDGQLRTAVEERNYERAAWLERRRARLDALIRRLGGVLRATHAGARLVLAPHPSARGRFDALWIAGGRVVDWGALPREPGELELRTAAALRATPRPELGGWLPAEEIAEMRLVGAWIAANAPPVLELGGAVDGDAAAALRGAPGRAVGRRQRGSGRRDPL